MLKYPYITLVGLGHRARSGKDSVANILKNKFNNVKIIHWADGVYEECTNEGGSLPLIRQTIRTETKTWYVKVLSDKEVPYLHKIFIERDIIEYQGMLKKDPEILQFWGTNFRREFFGKDYWVKRTFDKIEQIAQEGFQGYILIPDTRFKNEAIAIKEPGGYYIKVVRTNENGSMYIAKDRDPNHSSEIDLEDFTADFTLTAINLYELYDEVSEFILKSQIFK